MYKYNAYIVQNEYVVSTSDCVCSKSHKSFLELEVYKFAYFNYDVSNVQEMHKGCLRNILTYYLMDVVRTLLAVQYHEITNLFLTPTDLEKKIIFLSSRSTRHKESRWYISRSL